MVLSARLGCLEIPKPISMVTEFSYFEKITAPPVGRNLWQQFDLFDVSHQRNLIKTNIQRLKQHETIAKSVILLNDLPSNLKRSIKLTQEKVASSLLTVLVIVEHGFFLNKSAFQDAIHLRYGWRLQHLSELCPGAAFFTVDHALNCHKSGFISIRHSEGRDFFGQLLDEICHDVLTEPTLQPLT